MLGAESVLVYATPKMAAFLRGNEPWRSLIERRNVNVVEVIPGHEIALGRLRITVIAVPHRDELSDTVGYRVRGPSGRGVLYVPDVDKWERWDRRLDYEVAAVDVALLDGTFHDAAELPGRDMSEVPHPFVPETLQALPPPLRKRVRFIHLNHTNRLLWDEEARRALEQGGFRVAVDGEDLPL
jgi:pyrroloquinoline quinone biosynthesis protein B